MDYKEKYEQALKRAKKLQTNAKGLILNKWLCEVFPELKESEDERIRKEIIYYLNREITFSNFGGDIATFKKWIAWLEKQSEQKQNVTDIISDLENYFATTTKEQQEKDWNEIKKWEEKYFNHNKHIEQNSTDKVEPKFKVGDIIINEYGFIMQIDGIDSNMYVYHILDGNVLLKHDITKTEESCHLWTIQDAKDGDVLVLNDEVFIYAHRKQLYSIAAAHCFVDSTAGFHFDGEFGHAEKGNSIHPATKEQRDLLLQKMKEAGYEWDAKKKELKKIGENLAWSKEDERICQETIDWFEKKCFPYALESQNPARESIKWLKSIKKRMKGE